VNVAGGYMLRAKSRGRVPRSQQAAAGRVVREAPGRFPPGGRV